MTSMTTPQLLADLVRHEMLDPPSQTRLIAYPRHWQVPAATEKSAYEAMVAKGQEIGFTYLGFPWATVIDGVRNDAATVSELLHAMNQRCIRTGPSPDERRATVAQHIHADRFIELFQACGVTDLFWSHARKDRQEIGGITIHPFPLFPAQVPNGAEPGDLHRPRKWLANFIGAYNPKIYLSDVRARIFDDAGTPDLLVVKREDWHFQRAVYTQQIAGVTPDTARLEIEAQHKAEYLEAIRESVFTLCPTGSGPNSIRVGEALALGSIPIILTRDLALPGDPALWEAACLFEGDSAEGYRRALERARGMPEAERRRRREATQQLFATVGPQSYGELIVAGMAAGRSRVQTHVQGDRPPPAPNTNVSAIAPDQREGTYMAAAEVKRIPGTLVVAGIGAAEPFEALLEALGGVPERVILVESAKTPGGARAQRFAGMEGVSLVDAVIGEAAGAAELVRYNLPGLRSTATPSDTLRWLFPGLKARATVSTRAIPVTQLLDDPDTLPAPVRLRIDMPGAEAVILQGMEDCGALDRIDLLSLRCGAEAMFEGARDRAALQSWCEARYFKLDLADEEDPDWPELRFAPDPARRRIATLEATLAERDAALAEARSHAEQQGARVSELERALSETEAARGTLETALAEAREAAQAEAEKHKAHAQEKEDACAQAYKDRDKAHADLGLAMRMQGLLQSDLDDLRERFRQSEETRTGQEALLRKLTPRLQDAAQQLRQLQLVTEPDAAPEITASAKRTRAKPRATGTRKRKRTTRETAADDK